MTRDSTSGDCASCPLQDALSQPLPQPIDRREFLWGSMASALIGMGAFAGSDLAGQLAALPMVVTRGTGRRSEKAYPIPATDSMSIDPEESVIVAHVQGHVYGMSLACPHQQTAIGWDAPNNRFECPKHKSRFHLDGTYIEGRAKRSLDRFAVKLNDDQSQLLVNLDALYREDQNSTEWAAAFVTVA